MDAERKRALEHGPEADARRRAGNACYAAGEYQDAANEYRKAIAVLANDARAHANLTASKIRMAMELEQMSQLPLPPGCSPQMMRDAYMGGWQSAVEVGGKAATLDRASEKSAYYLVRAKLGLRDFPRALLSAREGAQRFPDSARLRSIVDRLEALGVPDGVAIGTERQVEDTKQRIAQGAATGACPFCAMQLALPLPQPWCPYCACNAEARVDARVIRQLRLADL